jgi:hypothetical protein
MTTDKGNLTLCTSLNESADISVTCLCHVAAIWALNTVQTVKSRNFSCGIKYRLGDGQYFIAIIDNRYVKTSLAFREGI